jgi:hypothetical protein
MVRPNKKERCSQMETLPTNAAAFIAFMERVWRIEMEPAEGGGVMLFASPLYDQFHDALAAARACGMKQTGTTKVDGDWWPVYRFPGAIDGVRIEPSGNAIQPACPFRPPRLAPGARCRGAGVVAAPRRKTGALRFSARARRPAYAPT